MTDLLCRVGIVLFVLGGVAEMVGMVIAFIGILIGE